MTGTTPTLVYKQHVVFDDGDGCHVREVGRGWDGRRAQKGRKRGARGFPLSTCM